VPGRIKRSVALSVTGTSSGHIDFMVSYIYIRRFNRGEYIAGPGSRMTHIHVFELARAIDLSAQTGGTLQSSITTR
jgi:hypothetical protein